MPFGKRKQGNKFQVINTETGDVKGTHDSEADADKQLAALHANDADKDKGHMDIRTKAVNATIEDTSANADEYPGTFLVELSNESLDRDGDILKSSEWEQPLPQQITFVNDHNHKMASVVGSATPELVGDKVICKGEWAATTNAQETRKVIKHVPYVSVAYREKRDHKAGTVSRELINGSFVVVPSNTRARVLASKSFDGDGLDDEVRSLVQDIVKETLKSAGIAYQTGSVLPGGFTAEMQLDGDSQTLTVKDAEGKTLLQHKFSQSTEQAPPKGADPQADPAKEDATELESLKSLADQILTNTTV